MLMSSEGAAGSDVTMMDEWCSCSGCIGVWCAIG